jgi:hypothetical protein
MSWSQIMSNKKALAISGRAYSHGSPSWIFGMFPQEGFAGI